MCCVPCNPMCRVPRARRPQRLAGGGAESFAGSGVRREQAFPGSSSFFAWNAPAPEELCWPHKEAPQAPSCSAGLEAGKLTSGNSRCSRAIQTHDDRDSLLGTNPVTCIVIRRFRALPFPLKQQNHEEEALSSSLFR